MVESTLTSQVIIPAATALACSAARIRFQFPLRCHRRNNPSTVCHGPYIAGTSRQGAPGPDPPADPVDESAFAPLRRATPVLPDRQQRLEHHPPRIGQIGSPNRRYAGHEVSGTDDRLGR
jgi:hypothetical protein